jgi:hypothetical protein
MMKKILLMSGNMPVAAVGAARRDSLFRTMIMMYAL